MHTERRKACGGAGKGVVSIFHPQELPWWRVLRNHVAESCFNLLFICSFWLLDWGWKPSDWLTVAPKNLQNYFQNTDVKWGPWSGTTSMGRPWSRKMCCSPNSAVSLAEGMLGRGTKWAILLNRPTTLRVVVFLLGGGGLVTKSDIGARMIQHQERLQKTSRSLARRFVLTADWAGFDNVPTVLLQGG